MGFFTDAYDLFVIGIASALITKDWHLSPGHLAVLNSTMLAAAFVGAFVFGRYADMVGRKRVYWLVAAIMIAGALGSALRASFWVLIAFRFVLGFGVGGDYPVSAVMVSEYANRKDRGRLVGMVFGTQALGLIIGPLIALALLGSGVSDDMSWRILLGAGRRPGRGGDLPALPDARIAPLPGPGAGRRAAAAGPGLTSSQVADGPGGEPPADRAAGVPDRPPLADHAGRDGRVAGSCSTTPTTATRSPPRRSWA